MKYDMMKSEIDKNGKHSYVEMCSSGYVTVGQMCSLLSSDTYRECLFNGKKR